MRPMEDAEGFTPHQWSGASGYHGGDASFTRVLDNSVCFDSVSDITAKLQSQLSVILGLAGTPLLTPPLTPPLTPRL